MEKPGSKLKKMLFCVPVVFWLLCGTAAWSQDKARLVLKTEVAKELRIKEKGKETVRYVPVNETKPKDVLAYSITYRNEGRTPAVGASIVDPIPKGTVYIAGSATGKDAVISFSIDGGTTYQRPPVCYTVIKPDGTREEREAPPEMYTHIRWMMENPISPGMSGDIGFRVRIE